MRLWSIHPKYLDTKGLLAVWREGLLAKKVLENRIRGYKNHPQLIRFKNCKNPIFAINAYLFWIREEARKRGYKFDREKAGRRGARRIISVTSGQVRFEFGHLLEKLKKRDKKTYEKIKRVRKIEVNPVFKVKKGKTEVWEKI